MSKSTQTPIMGSSMPAKADVCGQRCAQRSLFHNHASDRTWNCALRSHGTSRTSDEGSPMATYPLATRSLVLECAVSTAPPFPASWHPEPYQDLPFGRAGPAEGWYPHEIQR